MSGNTKAIAQLDRMLGVLQKNVSETGGHQLIDDAVRIRDLIAKDDSSRDQVPPGFLFSWIMAMEELVNFGFFDDREFNNAIAKF